MVEFNIHWGEGAEEELMILLGVIKRADMKDVHINVLRDHVDKPKAIVPEMRLKQMISAIDAAVNEQKLGLTKAELISVLTQPGSGISELTASVYISNASGAGLINRTPHGYVSTAQGRSLCKQ